MPDVQEYLSSQGFGQRIPLADGEVATVVLDRPVPWENGGFSWAVVIAKGAASEVEVEHSLDIEGDDWIPDIASPFTVSYGDTETGRIARMRFTWSGAAGHVKFLTASSIKTEAV